jgi:hypothetical protein
MAYVVVLVFEGVGEDKYWAVNEKLGIGRGSSSGYPAGLLVHTAGPTPTGWVVSEVWDNKQSQIAFMQSKLGAALQAIGLPPPSQIIETDTVNYQKIG